MQFGNPLGLISLLSIGILILFYFFYKKPIKKIFPSIMFFIEEKKATKTRRAWKYISTNLPFFLQLFFLIFAGFAIAQPFLVTPVNATESQVVIVLDSSASMQAKYDSSTRFDETIKEAIKLIEGRDKVSLILAEPFPLIVAEKESSSKVSEILKKIQPSDSPTNLEEALFQAATIIDGGSVHVFSDFTEDPSSAQRQLNIQGTNVVFHKISKPVRNVGIIDVNVLGLSANVKIKNFQSTGVEVKISSNTSSETRAIPSGGIVEYVVDLTEGENVVSLDVSDQFLPDNKAFIYVPVKSKLKTLYITNQESTSYLRSAMNSLGLLDIQTTFPPIIPQDSFQLYVVENIDSSKILPTTFEDIIKKVKGGSNAIIHVQKNVDYGKLSAFDLGVQKNSLQLFDKVQNSVTSNINFGYAKPYSTSNVDCDSWVVTLDGDVLVCRKQFGKGFVTFYALQDSSSSFKTSTDYPVFWNRLIRNDFGIEQDKKVNLQTGSLIPVEFQTFKTPLGEIKTNKLILQKSGFYEGNDVFAANLVSFDESNVNVQVSFESDPLSSKVALSKDSKKDLSRNLILIALVFILVELFVIKWRGDL